MKKARLLWIAVVVLVSAPVLAWWFSPRVQVLGYQTLLVVGPVGVRKWAVEELEPMGELALPALALALEDEEVDIRSSAAWALRNLRKAAIPVLIKTLRDEHWAVRGTAAFALGQMGGEAKVAVPSLIEALKDEDIMIARQMVASVLGDVGDKAAVPALTEALRDEREPVRDVARKALDRIQGQSP